MPACWFAHFHIKEMSESNRHITVSAEARRGVIRYVGMKTITQAELCRRYIDNTTSPCTTLLVMETTNENNETKQWHICVINK